MVPIFVRFGTEEDNRRNCMQERIFQILKTFPEAPLCGTTTMLTQKNESSQMSNCLGAAMKTQSAVGAFPDPQSALRLVRFGSTEFTESTDDHSEEGDISDVELTRGCHEGSVNPVECCGSLSRSSRRPQGNGCVASQRPSPPLQWCSSLP